MVPSNAAAPRAWLLATLVASAGLAPAPIAAQPAPEADEASADRDARARLRFERASSLYAAGSFVEAAEEFEAAYELSGRPALLYNMYVAWRDAGDLAKAADALERYLEEVPEAPERVTLEARLASMKERLAEQWAAEEAARRAAELEAARAAEETRTEEPTPPIWRVLPWAVGGVGVAALVAGAVTGGLALGQEGDLEEVCPNDQCPASAQGDIDRLHALATATDVLLVTGALATAAGVVLLFVRPGGPRGREAAHDDDAAAVAPFGGCGATGCVAGLRGRFR